MGGSKPRDDREPALLLEEYGSNRLDPSVAVYLPFTLTSEEFHKILPQKQNQKAAFAFVALQQWFQKLQRTLQSQDQDDHPFHAHPYRLHELDIQAVDWFWRGRPGHEDKLGFMKIQAKIETDPYLHDGEDQERADWLPGAVFLRGGSVGVLIIVQPEGVTHDYDKHVILTVQPRVAAASLCFTEIPAGMLDGNSLQGTAAKEIEEEAHLSVKEQDLINLSELADELDENPDVEIGVYPSPGACDEFIPLFLCQKRLTRKHMEWLKGKATGLRDEGENITLKLVPYKRAWRELSRDAKGLAALSLYENLRREDKIPSTPEEVEPEPENLA